MQTGSNGVSDLGPDLDPERLRQPRLDLAVLRHRAVGDRRHPRIRPLHRRPLDRHRRRGVLARLRPGAGQPHGPPRHPLADRRHSLRRLCEIRRRRQCGLGARPGRAGRDGPGHPPPLGAWRAALGARRHRRRRTGVQPGAVDADLRRARWPVRASRSRRSTVAEVHTVPGSAAEWRAAARRRGAGDRRPGRLDRSRRRRRSTNCRIRRR